MTKTSYIAVCAVAALGFSLVSPQAASAFTPLPGADKTYTQTVTGNEAISVRLGVRGGAHGVGLGRGYGWGVRGVGLGRGYGWGWRGGYGGWGGGYGWGWPVGLGVGLAAATTYPYYGYYGGYSPAYYGGCGW